MAALSDWTVPLQSPNSFFTGPMLQALAYCLTATFLLARKIGAIPSSGLHWVRAFMSALEKIPFISTAYCTSNCFVKQMQTYSFSHKNKKRNPQQLCRIDSPEPGLYIEGGGECLNLKIPSC